LPKHLIKEVNEARKWLKKPDLPAGNYTFYLTEQGKKKYEETLLQLHMQYLENIQVEESLLNPKSEIVYQDEDQIVIKQSDI
jgi:hypothetical protein